MPEIHAARRGRAQEKIAEVGAAAALITSGPNVRYLTGLASSNAALLLAADGAAVLATDSRYTLAAQRDCPDVEVISERFIETRLAAELAGRGLRTVAFEAHEMTVERHRAQAPGGQLGGEPQLDEALGEQFNVGAVPPGGQRVPRVRGQHRGAVGGQQQRGVGAGQAGEVADVGA